MPSVLKPQLCNPPALTDENSPVSFFAVGTGVDVEVGVPFAVTAGAAEVMGTCAGSGSVPPACHQRHDQ